MTSNYADRITAYDSTDMYSVLCDYPGQIRTGIDIGNTVNLGTIDTSAIRNLLICGMGGSAIGGDVLRVFASGRSRVPILVNRDYRLPFWVDKHTLVVVMSYSGGTEESLSAYDEAGARGAQRIVVTSGGELLERAERDGVSAAIVPGGLAPRCALGYLFFPLLMIAARCDLFDLGQSALKALVADVEAGTKDLADYTSPDNPAIAIAEKLRGTIPVLYGGQSTLDAVLMRWRCQIEENAKVLAYSNVLPEMNHNEIVGWEQLPDMLKRITVVALHDSADIPQLRKRMSITLDIIRPLAADVLEIHAREENELSRVFGLILLGDWVSFYLAVTTGVDPFPIRNINHLKQALAQAAG
jgi:glucose/mannose-6-phosphate isomerase